MPLRDYAALPEPAWLRVMEGVGVRELCMLGRTNRCAAQRPSAVH